jgi:hypothetical protein
MAWGQEKKYEALRKFRDEPFALTTLQNPTTEVRTYAELVQAAQRAYPNTLPAGRQACPPTRRANQSYSLMAQILKNAASHSKRLSATHSNR